MVVKERFSNGKTAINVMNVGELIYQLQRLPIETPVVMGFSPSADLVLFNPEGPDPHIALDETGAWDEDVSIESQDLRA